VTARAKETAATGTEEVVLKYDLFDLPTAQHKAGLAGLILQVRSMAARRLPAELIPEVIEGQLTPTSAAFRFTERSVQGLFDDLYDARVVEVAVKAKWPGEAPKREEVVDETDPETKKVTRSRRFVYDVVQPAGHFLRQHLPEMEDGKGWHKLWRDMLWAIPRGVPQSRLPFRDRAEGRPCRAGLEVWKALRAVARLRTSNGFHTEEVAGPLWLGAQACNAEGVPFRGRAEHNLLLHFWPLTALVFVPRRVNNDGEGEFVGYALAVPEVADLEAFCEDYPLMLHELRTEVRGYRPAAAVIDLPAQAALEFLENLARLAQRVTAKKRINDSVSSVEYLHLVKVGNNVKSMAAGRVAPRPGLLDAYLAVVGDATRRPPFRNPLFRSGLLLALLRDRPWYECLAPMLAERPWPFFVRGEGTPRSLPWFAADAAAKLKAEHEAHERELEVYDAMQKESPAAAGTPPKPPLPDLVRRLVRRYVLQKTEEKSGLKWEAVKDTRAEDGRVAVPKPFREAKEKVIADAFLAMRSRREQDFVDYFTATICSARQFLREEEFGVVADALLTRPEDVKTLTLLALSASS
jgi:CRISPR-associated protein Cmx8